MTEEPLGNHAQFIRGVTFKPTDKCEVGKRDSLVCLRTANVQQTLDESDLIAIPANIVKNPEKLVRLGDILVSSANSWNLVGRCCRVESLRHPSAAGGFISILRADPSRLDPSYLYRWFASDHTQATVRSLGNQTTNISNLDHKRTLSLPIPLPPLPEQKRIAAILDAADALRAKRRESIEQLDSLVQATFLEMFGDPVKRPGVTEVPDEWTYETIADVVSDEKYSCVGGPFGSDLTSKDYVDEPGVPVIRGGDLATDSLNMREDQFVFVTDEKAASLSRNMAFRGDVVVSQRGARLAGQVALIPENSAFERYVVSQSQMKVTLNPERMLAKYLITYMRSPKGIFEMESRTISTGVPHTNLGILKNFPVPVPPLERQQEFVRTLDLVELQRARLKAHLAELDALFSSLQSRAFNGELVA
jgi:type I restriction enzyme, S subunit